MNIRAGLEEYILQTHNTNFFEDSMGGLKPLTLPFWVRQWVWLGRQYNCPQNYVIICGLLTFIIRDQG